MGVSECEIFGVRLASAEYRTRAQESGAGIAGPTFAVQADCPDSPPRPTLETQNRLTVCFLGLVGQVPCASMQRSGTKRVTRNDDLGPSGLLRGDGGPGRGL